MMQRGQEAVQDNIAASRSEHFAVGVGEHRANVAPDSPPNHDWGYTVSKGLSSGYGRHELGKPSDRPNAGEAAFTRQGNRLRDRMPRLSKSNGAYGG
jgi:hypothetical protein